MANYPPVQSFQEKCTCEYSSRELRVRGSGGRSRVRRRRTSHAGLARSDAGAASLASAQVEVLRASLEDVATLKRGAAAADGVIPYGVHSRRRLVRPGGSVCPGFRRRPRRQISASASSVTCSARVATPASARRCREGTPTKLGVDDTSLVGIECARGSRERGPRHRSKHVRERVFAREHEVSELRIASEGHASLLDFTRAQHHHEG